MIATTKFEPLDPRPVGPGKEAAARSRDYVRRHWRYQDPAPESAELTERARSHSLCISGMAFQDAWNIDLERLRECFIHVVSLDNRIVPFCAYNLTAMQGDTLYRGRCV